MGRHEVLRVYGEHNGSPKLNALYAAVMDATWSEPVDFLQV